MFFFSCNVNNTDKAPERHLVNILRECTNCWVDDGHLVSRKFHFGYFIIYGAGALG